MANIVGPILVVEEDDILSFGSVRDAEQSLEPIDVKLGGFSTYDSEGRLLRVSTDGRSVHVSATEEEASHRNELQEALRRFLKANKAPEGDDPACNLPCLVKAIPRLG